MAQFLLVHGSFHGAWCWDDFAAVLTGRGHRACAVDLPGSGIDPAPIENADLETYATRVAGAIDGLAGPVVLVGHSMGGIVASEAAQRRAGRLAALVYVNGLLLQSGESLVSFLEAYGHLGVADHVLENMVVSADGAVATFPEPAARDVFYNTCSPDVAARAAARLGPQRMKVYGDRVSLTPDRYGAVRRFYIEGLQDRAASIDYQRAMTKRMPCEEVFTLDCDHSPFLSRQEALADIFDRVAHSLR